MVYGGIMSNLTKEKFSEMVKEVLMDHLKVDVYHNEESDSSLSIEVELKWDDETIFLDRY